jgi:hypothetical protein
LPIRDIFREIKKLKEELKTLDTLEFDGEIS